ncbi:L-aminoadipate-semialdehyde dehydrogenase [Lentinula aciculospora]|uniref:L-aminoadipate-semialdehyde dehydrogenase n=1 Tax=Lentinula aciculospora TaxID=153920 RepID=A0A9W9A596_9AGAR|nr:L-aminoadipate-semialdehyde dehydrogenase [Lentinula aciculospora]
MPPVVFEAKVRSTTELLNIRACEQPNDPAIYTGIPESDGSLKLRSLSYGDILRAVDRLAWYYSSLDITPKVAPGEIPPMRTIAVLVTSSIDEILLELALIKMGLSALLLSVNNSVAAVIHLTKITNSTHLIYSSKFVEEAKEAQMLLREQGVEIGIIQEMRIPLWVPQGVVNTPYQPFLPVLSPDQEISRTAIYLHSSGSTGLPKPLLITHRGLMARMALKQEKTVFSTLPVFHGYGHFVLVRCLHAGRPFTLFPPHLPLTSTNICAVHAQSPDTRQFFAVPHVIKLLGETEEGVRMLATFDVVSYGGAPLPDDIGTRLTDAGVNILSSYGISEAGVLMTSARDFSMDKKWNWVHPIAISKEYMVMEPQGNDIFECVLKDGFPATSVSNRPDGSFATKDLFQRHPEEKNQYRYIGRLDDTLVHTLGEKTNPVPMELCIRGNSPYVAEVIVFGSGKPTAGCLILPSDLAKDLSEFELMERIWPCIEQANAEAPTHSRLLPEMVGFLPYGTQVPVTPKMTILRPACYIQFKGIIEDIYSRFDAGHSNDEKLYLSKAELEDYLLHTIAKTLGSTKAPKLDKKVDLFAFGVDSLQAIRVRNTCQKELDLDDHILGQNVVYEYPSIERLADYLQSLRFGEGQSSSNDYEVKMSAMVDKWVTKLESYKLDADAKPKPKDARVVILTGATGSLGAHILHQLIQAPSVHKVICLSRARSHEESRERVKESLKLRKLPMPDGPKFDSYAANPNIPQLGLTNGEYTAMRAEVTDVIHNAWPVNFALSLESFDEHIGGSLNLMNLCLQSPYTKPAAFYFSSSVSCCQGSLDATCTEDYSSSPSTAAGTGYAQSKWVVEKLCQKAADITELSVGVLRISQMVGDSANGVWNETEGLFTLTYTSFHLQSYEAWSLMFKSADIVGALPTADENPSWLPVDYAGQAVAEIVLNADPPKSAVYHIVNPNTSASWNDILDGLNYAGMKFERVEPLRWVERLAQSNQDGEQNPAVKLLPFFRLKYGVEHRKPMVFLTEKTQNVALSIRCAPPITKDLIVKWIRHWKESKFM